jgi:hypothetical protein
MLREKLEKKLHTSVRTAFINALSKSQTIVVGFKSTPFLVPILFRHRKIASHVSCRLFDVKIKQTGTDKNNEKEK